MTIQEEMREIDAIAQSAKQDLIDLGQWEEDEPEIQEPKSDKDINPAEL